MYTGKHAHLRPLQPAFIMARFRRGRDLCELEARCNRLAHLLRSPRPEAARPLCDLHGEQQPLPGGLRRRRAVRAVLHLREFVPDGERTRLHRQQQQFAHPDHVGGEARCRPRGAQGMSQGRTLHRCRWPRRKRAHRRPAAKRRRGLPRTPIADECIGTAMLYSSGTTGRPKGILRPLPEQPPTQQLPMFDFLQKLWQYREGMIYLSPAPLYHSAPQAAVNLAIRNGGTVIIMESFDPERYLELVEKWGVTHTQLVPTMFSRMLKLPEAARKRHDLSSLEIAIHAAAPCPALVKDDMIKWWGPIIHEYYGATEGLGFTACNSERMAGPSRHRRQGLLGDLHILDEDMQAQSSWHAGHGLVQDRDAVRIFQRSEQDPGGALAGRQHEHGRRRRLCRRRRLSVSHRPRDLHDHLRRSQHLPAGMREPA